MLTYPDWSSKREDPGGGVSGDHFFSAPRGISKTIDIFGGRGTLIFAMTLFSPEQGGRQRQMTCRADRNENARAKWVFQGPQGTGLGHIMGSQTPGRKEEEGLECPLPIPSLTPWDTEAPEV